MYNLKQRGNILTIKDFHKKHSERFIVYEKENINYKTPGVYGMVNFNKIKYLIVIKSCKIAGTIYGQGVYEINEVNIFTIGETTDYTLIERINGFFKLPGVYFSKYDLHRRCNAFDNSSSCADNTHFVFNNYPLSVYKRYHSHFTVNCIQGYFSNWNGLCLISRRSCARVGARYFSRGCDKSGQCSNFVETEQILERGSTYLQIRGSIPFEWGRMEVYAYDSSE